MRKADKSKDMRPEYRREDLGKGVRGKYLESYRKAPGAILVTKKGRYLIDETLHLLSIPRMRESIIEGLKTPVEECSKELDWRVEKDKDEGSH